MADRTSPGIAYQIATATIFPIICDCWLEYSIYRLDIRPRVLTVHNNAPAQYRQFRIRESVVFCTRLHT